MAIVILCWITCCNDVLFLFHSTCIIVWLFFQYCWINLWCNSQSFQLISELCLHYIWMNIGWLLYAYPVIVNLFCYFPARSVATDMDTTLLRGARMRHPHYDVCKNVCSNSATLSVANIQKKAAIDCGNSTWTQLTIWSARAQLHVNVIVFATNASFASVGRLRPILFTALGENVTTPSLATSATLRANREFCGRLIPGRVTHATSPCSSGWATCSARRADEAVCVPACNVLRSKSAGKLFQATLSDATNMSLHTSAWKTFGAVCVPVRKILRAKRAHKLPQAALTDATNVSLHTSA